MMLRSRSKLDSDWVLSESHNKVDLETDTFCTGTPLHLAAYSTRETPRQLKFSGASIDPVDNQNDTPLLSACTYGHIQAARVLLASRANPCSRGYRGRTPAMHAAMAGHMEILELLLDRNSDITSTSASGLSLLYYGAEGGPDIFSYLLMRGCCPYVENCYHNNPAEKALDNHVKSPAFVSLLFNLDLDFNVGKGLYRVPREPGKVAARLWLGSSSNVHLQMLFLKS
jgi:ankyrin repeat protein